MYHPQSQGYGDIFRVNTSHIDEMANRLYAQQKQKEALQRQGDANLDNEFAKELVGIKKADIPEVTQAWAKFKQAHINNQKKGAKATPDDQYAVLQEKANFFTSLAASKQEKERVKNLIAEKKADKKGRFKLGADATINKILNTPTSQIKPEDDAELYNQYSFPELPKVAANMMGKPVEMKLATGKPSAKGDLYDDENVYQKFNSPNKMFENGFAEISTRPDRENYERVVLDSLDDKEKEDLTVRYLAKINSPEFKAIYGDVQPFPQSAEKTELGKAVALSVMSAVDKLPVQPLRTESKPNTGAIMDKRRQEGMEDWLKKNRIVDQQKKARIILNNQGKQYEIDNVPLKIKSASVVLPTPQGGVQATDVTDWPEAELDDVLGSKRDKYGVRLNKPIEVQGKKYIKIVPNGFEVRDANDEPIVIADNDVIVNTDKRTRGLVKPLGKGEATIKNDAPKIKSTTKSGLPVYHP